MKRNTKILIGAGAVYLLLTFLLFVQEKSAGNTGFGSIWDAVWYSLITMTTVGYGDITPVTAGGKLIGILFALCSVGILTALIGLGLRLIGRQMIPQLRLKRRRHRPWFIFSEENADSAALAEAIQRESRDSVVIFLTEREDGSLSDAVRIPVRYEKLLDSLNGQKNVSFFFMSENPWENYSRGLKVASAGFPAFCMSDTEPEDAPSNLHIFGRNEALSRFYWQTHPLRRDESCVVFIGCGDCGSALLERALLINVFERGRLTEYHVFQDTAGFQALHAELCSALAGQNPGEDRLVFHLEDWREAGELLGRADRIILCGNSDEESLRIYDSLKKWLVYRGRLYVRLSRGIQGIPSFGGREEILTPEFVIKDAVNRQAVMMNELYNKGAEHPTSWKDLSAFHRQSNIAAADHLIVKVRYLLEDDSLTNLTAEDCRRAYARYRDLYPERELLFQEMEHRRWMRFSQMFNWRYSPVRDNTARLHPLLIPFDELPAAEKKKDDYAWEMLGILEL